MVGGAGEAPGVESGSGGTQAASDQQGAGLIGAAEKNAFDTSIAGVPDNRPGSIELAQAGFQMPAPPVGFPGARPPGPSFQGPRQPLTGRQPDKTAQPRPSQHEYAARLELNNMAIEAKKLIAKNNEASKILGLPPAINADIDATFSHLTRGRQSVTDADLANMRTILEGARETRRQLMEQGRHSIDPSFWDNNN